MNGSRVKIMKVLAQKKYQDHIPCSFSYKPVCADDKFGKPIYVSRGENAAYKNLLKQFLKNMNTVKK